MAALTPQQIERMRQTQEAHMMDLGHVMVFVTEEKDAHNAPVPRWSIGPAVKCGFQFKNETDEMQGRGDVPTIDAELRLPKETEICKWDRFRLTHRLGVAQQMIMEFETIGEPRLGPSGIVCDLMLATDVIRL